jgi:hypothetical protein
MTSDHKLHTFCWTSWPDLLARNISVRNSKWNTHLCRLYPGFSKWWGSCPCQPTILPGSTSCCYPTSATEPSEAGIPWATFWAVKDFPLSLLAEELELSPGVRGGIPSTSPAPHLIDNSCCYILRL